MSSNDGTDTQPTFELFMAHADTHEPVLPDGLGEQGAPHDEGGELGEANAEDPEFLFDDAAARNDLEAQRWGVFYPDTKRGREMPAAIRPLIERRRAQQGGHPVLDYAVPPLGSFDEAMRWRREHFEVSTKFHTDLPRYQLFLGDLWELPLSLQQAMSTRYYPGRLAFDDDRQLEAYVEKVLRWEDKPSDQADARAIFHTVHDQSGATQLGYRALVNPGLAMAREDLGEHFRAREILETGSRYQPSPEDLTSVVGEADLGVLFSVSHGEGAPTAGWRPADRHELRQGAMCFGRQGAMTAEDVAGLEAFLPGGIWFMLACYSAGTPDLSAYHPWLTALKQQGRYRGDVDRVLAGLPQPGERPFVAALPKAVLAHSNGPLAFMGHVDLAWSYAFQEWDSGKAVNQPARYLELLRSALRGDRVGLAFQELFTFFNALNAQVAEIYSRNDAGAASAAQAHLWMLRQDLSAYMLLGDPAARLPLAGEKAATAMSDAEQASLLGFAPSPARASPALPAPMEALERAFGDMLAGVATVEQAAARLAVPAATMTALFAAYTTAGREACARAVSKA
ncbi:MAG: C25 family cysteine peptidase [Pseudomonadota bacterium]